MTIRQMLALAAGFDLMKLNMLSPKPRSCASLPGGPRVGSDKGS
jgi:hypothetical protein